MEKPNWMIHYISNHRCQHCKKHNHKAPGFAGFANVHTHGFEDNGHDEICIPFDLGPQYALGILNMIGLEIRKDGVKYEEGFSNDILENGMRVEFYRSNNSEQLYMLMPDTEGRLPGEEGCDFPYSQQRIYADIIEEEEKEGGD